VITGKITDNRNRRDKACLVSTNKNTMIFRLIIFLTLLIQSVSAQELQWPDITGTTKPWTRMWWMGSIGTKADLTSAMEKYRDAGLGGIEVTCIYGVKGQEDKFVDYLTPEWMDKFMHILSEGKRLGLGIDLANASGWPFGGPWIAGADACRNINFKTYNLKEGELLSEKIEFIQQPLMRPIGQRPDMATLVEPVSRNKNLQLYALDQIRFEKKLPVHVLMAYSDNGNTIDLTSRVNSDGALDWKAPAGTWTLYALFEGWHGKLAERAGPGGEGDVIDHFSGKAIDNFLSYFDNIFSSYDISSLRGYFNDSYEVDDASGQANWTDDLFEEFARRRGYDLSNHLPALFQNDSPEKNAGVLSDYRHTISDLILEKFTTHWTTWANRHGKITRNQAHGSPGNILDLYAASDIPETEGYELTKIKFASSAAHVTGKNLISTEAATWLNEHFISTLADVKKAADLHFLGGVNHLFWHGTCFSPENEPWPGFQFYAAVEFSPANSFWNDFSALNAYVSRIQSFMQKGKPANNLLLYFPIFDRYADPGRGMLEHFDAIPPAYRKSKFGEAAENLPAMGYAYDYISDRQLIVTRAENGKLQTQGNTYDAIIIPECRYIPLETFSKIMDLARAGTKILFYGKPPGNVAGWKDFEKNNKILKAFSESLEFRPAGEHVSEAVTGDGKVIMGDDLAEMLNFTGIIQEKMSEYGIMFNRRNNPGGACYFVKNTSEKMFEGWLPLNVTAASAAIFNPLTGRSGLAASRTKDGFEVFLQLRPEETMIIEAYTTERTGNIYPFYKALTGPSEIKGRWQIEFISGGPELPERREVEKLVAWTGTGGEEVKRFSGTASYTIEFTKPRGKADTWSMDLGKVYGSARVYLNGKEIAVLTGPHFTVIIDSKLLKKKNTLEVRVSNLMANRIAWMDKNGIEWKKFYNVNFAARLKENNKSGIFDASHWEPMESGLTGPVTITGVVLRDDI
jgi:hypothetical protein